MVIKCSDPRCDIQFDQDMWGATQMVAHMRGSHGKAASVEEFLPAQFVSEPVVSKAETVQTYTTEPIAKKEVVSDSNVTRKGEKKVTPTKEEVNE